MSPKAAAQYLRACMTRNDWGALARLDPGPTVLRALLGELGANQQRGWSGSPGTILHEWTERGGGPPPAKSSVRKWTRQLEAAGLLKTLRVSRDVIVYYFGERPNGATPWVPSAADTARRDSDVERIKRRERGASSAEDAAQSPKTCQESHAPRSRPHAPRSRPHAPRSRRIPLLNLEREGEGCYKHPLPPSHFNDQGGDGAQGATPHAPPPPPPESRHRATERRYGTADGLPGDDCRKRALEDPRVAALAAKLRAGPELAPRELEPPPLEGDELHRARQRAKGEA